MVYVCSIVCSSRHHWFSANTLTHALVSVAEKQGNQDQQPAAKQ